MGLVRTTPHLTLLAPVILARHAFPTKVHFLTMHGEGASLQQSLRLGLSHCIIILGVIAMCEECTGTILCTSISFITVSDESHMTVSVSQLTVMVAPLSMCQLMVEMPAFKSTCIE